MFIFMNRHVIKSASKLPKTCFRHYSNARVKRSSSDVALNHFDQFYRSVFENWPSIRLGLLCPHSYCAVVNVFAENKSPEHLFGDIRVFNMKDAYNIRLGDLELSDRVPEICKDIPEEKRPEFDESILAENFSESESTGGVLVDTESEFMPATKLMHQDFDSTEYTDFFTPNPNFKAQIIKHGAIQYPENWEMYYCPRGKFVKFPSPTEDVTGLLNYYLMDGASLLPVLALDVRKGEEVGDLCASPGGKTLAILFGMQFAKLVCNDASRSRVKKLKTVLNSYLPGTHEWSKKILVSNLDVTEWNVFEAFDKILLDVPCTNDRMSANKEDNNIFSQMRFSERMKIPHLQTSMLCAALKALKPGGSLVYSTCSLSPIQNDGVVHMALSKLAEDLPSNYMVQDLTEVFSPLRNMFKFSDNCAYGQLVVPFLPLNYGPMYISKITREKQ